MRSVFPILVLAAGLLLAPELSAQTHGHHAHGHHAHTERAKTHHPRRSESRPDTAFAALQERGEIGMGVDQYASTHQFDSLPDGGRIEYLLDNEDPEGISQIRTHLRQIARAFAEGDFSTPAFVHAQQVSGTEIMATHKDKIRYTFRELPRGGEIRITTRHPESLRAIHSFMNFQRQDHRAGGHKP